MSDVKNVVWYRLTRNSGRRRRCLESSKSRPVRLVVADGLRLLLEQDQGHQVDSKRAEESSAK